MSFFRKRIFQFLISIVSLVALIYLTDINQVKSAVKDADYLYLILGFIIMTFDRILMGVKWNVLLRAKNIVISWWEAVRIYYTSSFFGFFLPATIGGDVLRVFYTSKKKFSKTDITASIITERILGFTALFIFSLAGAFLFFGSINNNDFNVNKLLLVLTSFTVFGISIFILSFTEKSYKLLEKFLNLVKNKKFLHKIVSILKKFLVSYQSYKKQKTALLFFLLLTFLEIFTGIVFDYAIALGFTRDVSFSYFVAFVPIMMALVRIPISVDGFGINEGGFVYFLSLVGISKGQSLSIGLIGHIIAIIAIIPGGIFYALNKGYTDRLVKSIETEEEQNVSI